MEMIENKYSCPFLTFYEHIEIYSTIKIKDVLSDLVVNSNKKYFNNFLQLEQELSQDEFMFKCITKFSCFCCR
jgi:hypothetical protein